MARRKATTPPWYAAKARPLLVKTKSSYFSSFSFLHMKQVLRSLAALAVLALLGSGPAIARGLHTFAAASSQASPADYDQGYADGVSVLQNHDPQFVADEIQKANYLLGQATTLREYDYTNGYLNGLQAY
jgi:hypothetical protein